MVSTRLGVRLLCLVIVCGTQRSQGWGHSPCLPACPPVFKVTLSLSLSLMRHHSFASASVFTQKLHMWGCPVPHDSGPSNQWVSATKWSKVEIVGLLDGSEVVGKLSRLCPLKSLLGTEL